ncbi:RNA polymerase sigma factor [Hymenobacter canadensis]|uniref:RNA polymerase sigma-70 factor n=1 Tax=Hymenobacter canadensis TaxID=2999067 RepID=A0ABY7LPU9_9BACT|nr:RNA polymerase sigma-70 factor [Hymenobacter canadensis]WBA40913.1 RNA polymerase sigma-70 factor [Hymenobacter canadensis]
MSRPAFTTVAHPTQQVYASWDDAALVQALRHDDTLAFAQIYERHWWPLFQLAARKLGSREVAEEIVQDLFTVLWHKRAEHQIQHLQHYLHAAVRHRVIDCIKARAPRETYVAYHGARLMQPDHCTEEEVAADELSGALQASLTQLPRHTREVFRLSRFEHQSVPEIAVRLNLSRKTVEYHLTRALRQLRVSLKDFLVLMLALLGVAG